MRDGALTIGGTAAAGTSRIAAVDQTLFVKSLTVQTGTSGVSELKASGKQVVSVLNGNLNVLGGSGANTVARIDPVEQTLLVNGAVTVQGGSGANAVAQINSSGSQTVLATNGNITVLGGGGGSNASIEATGVQSIGATGNVSVTGGDGALARIATAANQTFAFSNLNLLGGPGAGSVAEITAGGTQTLTGGNITLTGGGTPASSVANASATIQGNAQMITAANLLLNGGTGNAGGNSDAVIRNLSGNQTIAASGVTLNGGVQFSTTGILNVGAGTQTVSSGSGIFLNSAVGASGNATVQIQNAPATLQVLGTGGGFGLVNRGNGLVSVSSGGDQLVDAPFVDIVTRAGTSGDAILSAAGNQTIHTSNGTASTSGSLRVTAFGVGKANIESGANQTLNIDVPEQTVSSRVDGRLTVGDINASGLSRIGAVNQTITAKSVLVQTGNTGSRSEIKSSSVQKITVLNGNLDVRGGAGNNTLAQIDPIDQNILVNGDINIVGGSGVSAIAQVVSAGNQTITANTINVTGGSGVDSLASITAVGFQTLNGNVVLTPNVGGAKVGGASPTSGVLGGLAPGSVLSLQDNQLGVIGGAVPDDQNEDDPIRRAPICF